MQVWQNGNEEVHFRRETVVRIEIMQLNGTKLYHPIEHKHDESMEFYSSTFKNVLEKDVQSACSAFPDLPLRNPCCRDCKCACGSGNETMCTQVCICPSCFCKRWRQIRMVTTEDPVSKSSLKSTVWFKDGCQIEIANHDHQNIESINNKKIDHVQLKSVHDRKELNDRLDDFVSKLKNRAGLNPKTMLLGWCSIEKAMDVRRVQPRILIRGRKMVTPLSTDMSVESRIIFNISTISATGNFSIRRKLLQRIWTLFATSGKGGY